jgi:hypothetical protein
MSPNYIIPYPLHLEFKPLRLNPPSQHPVRDCRPGTPLRLREINNPAQVWSSPLMCILYTFACSNASSDWHAYPLKDASKFPSHYLWLLWSTRWNSSDRDRGIWFGLGPLCVLMSRAITDPTSNYRPEDAILSVEHYVASSGVIGEAELRV